MYSQIRNISIACIILITLGVLSQKATAATEEEMRAVMRGMLDAFNAHDVAQMSSYWMEDIVYDFVAQPPPMNGKDQAAAFLEGLFEGLPDFHGTQTRILVSGNIMVTEVAVTGTHLGELLGIPATGHSLQSRLLQIWEFEGDKVKWFVEYLDMASSLIQLGVMPSPEPPELVPSFTLPDAERTGLTSLEAAVELDALWDAHDLSGCAKGIHPDAEILMIPLGVPIDREGFIALSELEFLGFSDLRWQPVRSIDMGDGWVVTEIVSTGTHDGPYFGIPATGRSIMVRAGVLRRFDADGLLTNLHCYYDNMTILQQLTSPEFPFAGAWVEHIPPWENVVDPGIALHKLTPLDPEGNRLLYTVKFVNEVASLPGLPPIDYASQFIGEAVKTGLNTYEYTVVCYAATHQDELGQRRGQVTVIAMITGRAEMLGPDQRYDTQMYKWFTADQDVDPADGFPDAGQEPILTLGPFAGDAFTRVPLVPLPEGP